MTPRAQITPLSMSNVLVCLYVGLLFVYKIIDLWLSTWGVRFQLMLLRRFLRHYTSFTCRHDFSDSYDFIYNLSILYKPAKKQIFLH